MQCCKKNQPFFERTLSLSLSLPQKDSTLNLEWGGAGVGMSENKIFMSDHVQKYKPLFFF